MGEKRLGACFHLLEGLEPARIVRCQPELRTPVVIRRTQPAVARRLDAPRRCRFVSARAVAIAHAGPFDVPALVVAGRHAARGQKALADGTAALLGLAQGAAELIGHPGMLGPVMPAVGFVVRPPGFVDPVDRLFFHEKTLPCGMPGMVKRPPGRRMKDDPRASGSEIGWRATPPPPSCEARSRLGGPRSRPPPYAEAAPLATGALLKPSPLKIGVRLFAIGSHSSIHRTLEKEIHPSTKPTHQDSPQVS